MHGTRCQVATRRQARLTLAAEILLSLGLTYVPMLLTVGGLASPGSF